MYRITTGALTWLSAAWVLRAGAATTGAACVAAASVPTAVTVTTGAATFACPRFGCAAFWQPLPSGGHSTTCGVTPGAVGNVCVTGTGDPPGMGVRPPP